MKALRPLTVVTVGPLFLGLAFAVGAWIALPRFRELSSFGFAVGAGAAAGLAVFGPIAAILALADRRPEWLARHSWRIAFYSSVAIALSVGYFLACIRHNISDYFMLGAMAVAFLGAVVKAALGYASQREARRS